MIETIRTFVAVSIPAGQSLRRVIRELGEMGPAIKPAAADCLHLTLKFLGDTPRDQVPQVLVAMRNSIADRPSFEIGLTGLGAYPTKDRPSVVWAGVEEAEPLKAINGQLENDLTQIGFEKERREYTPHLTLARIRRKPPPALFTLLEQHASTQFGRVAVDAVTLYESTLLPEGPKYSVIDALTLA